MCSCNNLCFVITIAFCCVYGYTTTTLSTNYRSTDRIKEIAPSAINKHYAETVKQDGDRGRHLNLSFSAAASLIDPRTGKTHSQNEQQKASRFEEIMKLYREYKSEISGGRRTSRLGSKKLSINPSVDKKSDSFRIKESSFKEYLDKYAPAPEIKRRFRVGIVDPRTLHRAHVSVSTNTPFIKRTFEARIIDDRTTGY